MARKCEMCGKGVLTAASRSHSNVQTKKRRYPNLQNKVVNGKKMRVCTSCIKTMTKPARRR